MPIQFKRNKAVFSYVVGAEDAEALLDWLMRQKKPRIDLAALSHLHPANLQVLMAAGCRPDTAPEDAQLAGWIMPVLNKA